MSPVFLTVVISLSPSEFPVVHTGGEQRRRRERRIATRTSKRVMGIVFLLFFFSILTSSFTMGVLGGWGIEKEEGMDAGERAVR